MYMYLSLHTSIDVRCTYNSQYARIVRNIASFILSASMCSVAAQVYSLVRAFAIHLFHKYQNFIITSSNNIIGRLTFLTLFFWIPVKRYFGTQKIHHSIEILTGNPLKYKTDHTIQCTYCTNIYGIVHQDEKDLGSTGWRDLTTVYR